MCLSMLVVMSKQGPLYTQLRNCMFVIVSHVLFVKSALGAWSGIA